MYMDSCQNCKNTYFYIDAMICSRKVLKNLQGYTKYNMIYKIKIKETTRKQCNAIDVQEKYS